MKRLKKLLSFASAILMLCACLAFNSSAAFELGSVQKAQAAAVQNVVRDYLGNATENMYLFTSKDIQSKTVQALPSAEKAAISVNTAVLQTQENSSFRAAKSIPLTDADGVLTADNILFMEDKVSYYKNYWTELGIEVENFSVSYDFQPVEIIGNVAHVYVYESINFNYAWLEEPSFLGTWYELILLKSGDNWYVLDVNCNDGFDSFFKSEDFDLESELASVCAAISDEPFYSESVIDIDDSLVAEISPNAVITSTRNYQPYYARRYAYTYSSQTAGTSVYNENFSNYSNLGGDCMNFVSQCIWAGFGGSNDTDSIVNRSFPMDTTGSQSWFDDSQWNHSSSWTSCSAFRTYTDAVRNSSSETGIVSQRYDIRGNLNDFSLEMDNYEDLYGSPLFVYGIDENGNIEQYAHAIIVTQVNGSNRGNIYYNAHTTDAKNMCLGQKYPAQTTDTVTGRICVVVPKEFRNSTSCVTANHSYSGIVAGNGTDAVCDYCGYNRMYIESVLKDPIPVNSRISLSSLISIDAFRVAMSVTSPSGVTTWMGEELNASYMSVMYTFTEVGDYVVKTLARDMNPDLTDTTVVSHTYVVRVY